MLCNPSRNEFGNPIMLATSIIFMKIIPSLLVLTTMILWSAGAAFAESGAVSERDDAADAAAILRLIDRGFSDAFEKVAPSVVVVKVSKTEDDGMSESMLEQFGLDFFFNNPQSTLPGPGESAEPEAESPAPPALMPQPRLFLPRTPEPPRSEGSGVIITADGHILTNFHVVDGADEISIVLRDGREFEASVVGTDDKTDLAVLKITDATGLQVASIGDSDSARVGQLVFAIGTPYNLDYTFTTGVVSAKGRNNLNQATYEDYLQTDAQINPGNSGGPLFDIEGNVLGINTLIHGVNRGLGFAIPINMARDIAFELIESGTVVRPWLGIRIDSLAERPSLKEHFKGIDAGVVVDTIEADAPAFRSDLRPADVITAVDGVNVVTARDLQKQILSKSVGAQVDLTVWRNGRTMTIPVTTEPLPGTPGLAARSSLPGDETPVDPSEPRESAFGLQVEELTPEIIEMYALDASLGVVVTAVAPDSAADVAGLVVQDVVTEVDQKPVTSVQEFRDAIASVDSKRGVLLFIDRQGEKTYAVLKKD